MSGYFSIRFREGEGVVIHRHLFHVYFFQVEWINWYHGLCAEKVGAALREQGRTSALNWLLKETVPIG